jgi:hypothetical protein
MDMTRDRARYKIKVSQNGTTIAKAFGESLDEAMKRTKNQLKGRDRK